MKRHFVIVILLLQIFFSFSTYANLLISPTRIEFDDRQRVAKIILINSSDDYKTYRLEWQEKQAKQSGGYKTLKAVAENPKSLSNMIRMSPSQVRLAPGERQIVKLALRKPKDLAINEYRSHLLFKALPSDSKVKESEGVGVNVNFILSYSIPVILRQGKLASPNVHIEELKLAKTKSGKVDSIEFTMARNGKYSSFGKLEAYFKAKSDEKEKKVSILNDFSIYPELNTKSLSMSLLEPDMLTPPGTLRVIYKGLNKYSKHTFFNEVFSIDESGSVTAITN
ncbi:molecular chaperone [Pseudoalteromonas sp. SR43-2]|uniref:fimbrial biogenesis chaperone n=1 Tax=Pseudoalteromonas sp. SR43-2 TaxID=2760944 RepID=UPI0015F788BB|nr:fimbria/pilus periplasmic chaperone [Pseudoalteromonas sp. SR43-2]MBB1380189.1 molecular chaperone [Pseudoalteromonas sp. SR43-2]